jgi:ribosomal protein S18 acetylase RimI-like enzyme
MNISVAHNDDIPAIVNLVNSAYRGENSKQGWTTEADLLDGIRTDEKSLFEMMQKPYAVILKYLDEAGHIAGSVYLQKQDKKLYLGMLTVAPNLQAKGVGKALLQASEKYALEEDCTCIIMTVISVRQELIDWYKRHGYHDTGKKEPFPTEERFGIPKQPLEFIVMEKEFLS